MDLCENKSLAKNICRSLTMEDILAESPQNTLQMNRNQMDLSLSFSTTIIFLFIFIFFVISWATPGAYGGSQARGPIGAVAAGLRHSKARSEPRLQPTPQLMAMWDP